MTEPQTIVVVGGGVAGVCCVEELESLVLDPTRTEHSNTKIVFISGTGGFIKTVANAEKIGQLTESFDVRETAISEYFESRRVQVLQETVVKWDPKEKLLMLSSSTPLRYDKLCIATGASARRTFSNPNVIVIRDTENIEDLQLQLPKARRILLVGNGGIATELVYELKSVELVWAIRHASISATYFDEAAAKFFEFSLASGRSSDEPKPEKKSKRYTVIRQPEESQEIASNRQGGANTKEKPTGCALGPHWISKLEQVEANERKRKLHVIRDVELLTVNDGPAPTEENAELPADFDHGTTDWNIWAKLSNKNWLGCDLVIEATGSCPNSEQWKLECEALELAEDGGILVDERMQTSIKDVYAAGDICTPRWASHSPHWHQIRLWTQARQMGMFCARTMILPCVLLDICFDLFSHVTTFFGFKVILLGDFAAKKLEKPFQLHYRITEGSEYIKVLTKDSRIHGAVLVGETDLEETIENLILNQTDISQIEEQLLDPDVDLEDYFD